MIFVLMGKSLAGKTYLQTKLKTLGIEPIITSTTRPKRSQKDTDYHFVTLDQFNKERYDDHDALAVREYHVADGSRWYYYLNRYDLQSVKVGSLILDYQGYLDLSIQTDEPLIGIYLDIPIKERIMRHYKWRSNEDEREFVRRLYDDEFRAFNEIDRDHSVFSFKSSQDAIDFIMQKVGEQN